MAKKSQGSQPAPAKAPVHYYRLRFYLNARHAMRWQDKMGEEHPHTWELICRVKKQDETAFIRFNAIEDQIQAVLKPLQGTLLNDLPEFQEVQPSLENLGDYFFARLNTELAAVNCRLTRLEIGESPTRFFVVSE